MSKLRFPLRSALTDRNDDEVALARIWKEIDAASHGWRSPRPGWGRMRWRRPVAFVGAAAAAVAGAAALVVLFGGDAGPLRLADGRPIATLDAAAAGGQPVVVALADGSSIELGASARLQPLESSGSTFSAVLERGRAAFDVRPGGPRRWRIECGLAAVEVLGTRFSCERSPGHLRVTVERGAVLVSGERIADRVRRLAAGESMDVEEAAAAAAAGTPEPPAPAAPAVPETPSAPEAPSAASPATTASWRELARRGHHHEAFAALGAQGVRRESRHLDVAGLFALADVARLSGHPAEAEAPLQRILRDFARDPQASIAAFALARLELDALGRPARAVGALERALDLGIPRALREDVRARLVEAHMRLGDRVAARAAAAAYAREFPGGRHAEAIRSRLSER